MGFNETGAGGRYLTVKKGQWHHKKKDGEVTTGYSITGRITKIVKKEDEWDGKPVLKCNVHFECEDSEGITKWIAQFNLESWYAVGFFSRIKKVDFEKDLELGVSGSDAPEPKASFCWMKQHGNPKAEDGKLKKDTDVEVEIRPEKKMFGTKEINDFTSLLAYAERAFQHFASTMGGDMAAPGQAAPEEIPTNGPPESTGPAPSGPFEQQAEPSPADDLPF